MDHRAGRGRARASEDADGRRLLHLTIGALVVLIGGLGLVERSTVWWPIVTWPVYSELRVERPGPTLAALEVRVRTADGDTEVLRQEDLVEPSRNSIADDALEGAVDGIPDRVYLAALAQRAVGEEITELEIWEVTWLVDIEAVPPLDRDDPVSDHLIVAFAPDGTPVVP